jgi:uncharacterized protein YlxW (UPF0749 family)
MRKFQIVILLFIVGLGIGVLFAAQIKAPRRISNPVVSTLALTNAEVVLDKDQKDLQAQIDSIKAEVEQKNAELKGDSKVSRTLISETEDLRNQVGLTAKNEKGFVITLADSQEGEPTLDSIVHAADLRDVINLLWLSGATGITLNDQRFVTTTSVDSVVNTILINNVKITNPFTIKVVGDINKIESALKNDNNLKDIKRRQKSNRLIFNYTFAKDVTINPYSGSFVINNAKVSK